MVAYIFSKTENKIKHEINKLKLTKRTAVTIIVMTVEFVALIGYR